MLEPYPANTGQKLAQTPAETIAQARPAVETGLFDVMAVLALPMVSELIDSALIKGYITTDELVAVANEIDLEPAQLNSFYQVFEEMDIEIREPLASAEPQYVSTSSGSKKRDRPSTETLQLMLRSAGDFDLLTAAQERSLAQRIERGDSLAKEEMVLANQRLVVSIAKNFRNQGLDFPELIQEGMIGLIRAAEKFDWRKGYKFSTYATWWIRQAVQRGLADKARTIRMPVHIVEKLHKIVRSNRRLTQILSREPSPEEIAEDIGMKVDDVLAIMKSAQIPVSLDKPIGEDEEETFGSLLPNESEPAPEDGAGESLRNQTLYFVLDSLTERERGVLSLRFGLNGQPPSTLDEVGKAFGVTRERIRQIETQALTRLRNLDEAQSLRDSIYE
ncbi:MAG TPA: sigma-70 family RNA polymerase sigma factor [Candidatus Saccharimonadales bacterium]|nr:sigma-70 family RNA polymerase sigma factor [Candidatus Saccharimonadales bacterium]